MIDQMISSISPWLRHFKGKRGQTLVEYALILAFMSVLAIAYMTILGGQVGGIYYSIMSALAAAGHGF